MTRIRVDGEGDLPERGREVVLRDGRVAVLRPSRAQEGSALFELYHSLSIESREARFFGLIGDGSLRQEAERHVRTEPGEAYSIFATAGAGGPVVGHACYEADGSERAEVGFTVSDDWQGIGLGTHLIGEIARAAATAGVPLLRAVVRPSNHRMIAALRDSGFTLRLRPGPDRIAIDFPPEITPDAAERFEEREWSSVIAAVEGFLKPEVIAVVGASRRADTIGGAIFHNLLSYGFTGAVLPINSAAPWVQGVKAYPSVRDAPGPIDLAVVAVPAAEVARTVADCADAGARRVIIISAGFAEAGPEGVVRQESLMKLCRARGIRVVGPNCMGVVHTHERVRLNATFAPTPPLPGRLAFMSQSGALGLAIMDHASRIGLGLSSFVSVGNKADISGNDLVRYWARDPSVDVILLYMESFGNPRKFSQIARRVAREKPIVAVKSGRSPAGARAAGSHTGALLAASDTTVDALFRDAGVIRTDTLEELFDVASLLAHQPVPRGRRVAIVSNAGGPGILCADACVGEGLEVVSLGEATRAELRSTLVPEASVENPVDMIASAPPEHFRTTIEALGRDPAVDAIVVIYVPPLVVGADAVAKAILEGARALARRKPLVTVFMQSHGLPDALTTSEIRIPSYAFPESAAIALGRVARYGEWLGRAQVEPAGTDIDVRGEAAAVIARALGREDVWLPATDVWSLLSLYGVPMVEQRLCTSPAEVQEAARAFGGPVALKAHASGLLHKTEAGAVELDIEPESAGQAAEAMASRVARAGHEPVAFTVQPMVRPGVEMIVGSVHDPEFGPVLACGAGGQLVELLGDVSVRLAPVSSADAREMLTDLKTYPLLTGYRGAAPKDAEALVRVIERVGALVHEFPQILELDLNPVVVHEEGAVVVDARIRVGPTHP